ncbi:MAG TPA: hypothetical protein EYN08_02060 [Gammaproteobacteria bacterium]|nr:hypothetical protein [Gammaproteobacteria bacterium]
MILGLDVSTSITGATILDGDKIVLCEAWDLRKLKSIFEKADLIKDRLQALPVGIEEIFIEEPFTFFKSGGSSAKTMAKLQAFNGVVSWICYDTYGITPGYFTASQARKLCDISVPRGTKAKEVVIKHLLTREPDFDIVYTKHGNPKAGETDRADSLVIAKAGYKVCCQREES